MIRPLCRCASTVFPLVTLGLVGAAGGTQQAPPVVPPQSVPMPMPAPGRQAQTGQPQISQTLAPQSPTALKDLNPAERRYGLPRNPVLGGPVDTDLRKPLTLERAIRIGLARQNTIAIAQTQIDSANARVTQARSLYYPQVTPTFQYQSSLQPGVRFNSSTGASSTGSFKSDNQTDVVAARQLLYDSGKREAGVGLARRSMFGSEYGLANQRQSVVLVVTQAYYNLLRDRELIQEQQGNADRAAVTRDNIAAQVKAGAAAEADLLQVEADLANARVQVFIAQTNYGISQASLKNAMGIVTSQPVIPPDTVIPQPDTAPDPIGLEPYVRQAYGNRLDVKQQQEQINAQGYNVRIAQINAGLSVSAEITEGYAFDPHAGEEHSLLFGVSYPLFDGGNTRAAIRETKAGLEQDRRSLDALEQNIRFDVEQSYVTREQARQQITAALLAVAAGEKNFASAQAKQLNGVVNIPEVTLAQNQLVNARVALVDAVYQFYIADAQLKRATGVNDPVFLPKVPGARPPVLQPR